MPVKLATLIVEDQPGAVAGAAGGLQELGVSWEQVHRVPAAAGVQHWQIAVVAHEKGAEEERLSALPGVVGLVEASSTRPVDRRRTVSSSTQGNTASLTEEDISQAPATVKPTSSGRWVTDATLRRGSAQNRALNPADWVPQLVDRFPAVDRLIHDLDKQTRTSPTRKELYRDIGERTGRCLAVNHPRIHQVETIEDALEHVIVGLLFPLARGVVHGQLLQIHQSDFLKGASLRISAMRQRLFQAQKTRADFVAGVIVGMLNHGERLPNVEVDTKSGRYQGVTQWLFMVRAS